MRLERPGAGARAAHLTYCTNIHPGETWSEVRANLERYLPQVKALVSPNDRFGVGLRLSAQAAEALRDRGRCQAFQDFLAAQGLYVFTINGFPYGPFHGVPVKEGVYLPDWRDQARLEYTDLLADLLAILLPEDHGLEGSVSTVPGAFKAEVTSVADVERMADMMVRHVAHLVEVSRVTGRTIALALEPEPCCYLETIEETIDFFEAHLFAAPAAARLASLTGLDRAGAEVALRRHLGVCLDTCHAAVEFESAKECVAALRRAGVKVAKVQLSAGLRIDSVTPRTLEVLRRFDDGVYLHQVVERQGAKLARYVDLAPAFAAYDRNGPEREWRIHFHVPIFLADLGPLSSTQDFLGEILALHGEQPISQHLEVETYTWQVLPERYRAEDVVTAVARELQWVTARLNV